MAKRTDSETLRPGRASRPWWRRGLTGLRRLVVVLSLFIAVVAPLVDPGDDIGISCGGPAFAHWIDPGRSGPDCQTAAWDLLWAMGFCAAVGIGLIVVPRLMARRRRPRSAFGAPLPPDGAAETPDRPLWR